jgi:hypothetical protein
MPTQSSSEPICALIIGAKARPRVDQNGQTIGRQRGRLVNVPDPHTQRPLCVLLFVVGRGWPQTVQPFRTTVARSPVGLSAGPA